MAKSLVIVESPAKAKTIKKYLGKGFEVLASYGHVRDLLPKEGAVDPANDFNMKFQQIEKNEKHVDAIAKALKKADALYLASVASVRHNPELNKLFHDKVSAGKSKKEALIIVSKKLATIIYSIFKYNKPYNPNRVFIQHRK